MIPHHIPPQAHRQQKPHRSKRRRRRQRRDILRRVLFKEDVRADYAHEVGERDTDGGEDEAPAFVWDVVVVPYV